MHYKNNNILDEKTLGARIDTTLFCIKCRLETECGDITRRAMLDALTSELDTLINPYLEKLIDSWNDELPYGKKRPLRVDWVELSGQADELVKNLEDDIEDMKDDDEYEMDRTQQKNLAGKLRRLSKNVLRIYELLHPRNLPEKYAGYFRNMLKECGLVSWRVMQYELENEISLCAAKRIRKFCEAELQKQLDKLAAYKDCNIIDLGSNTIYEEAVGIKLWQDATDGQAEAIELLNIIRTVMYLAELCQRPMNMVMCEPTEEEPRESATEQSREAAIIYISHELLEEMKSHTSQLERFLINGHTTEWVNGFWDSLARNRMSTALNRGRKYKHLCNILGELCRNGVYTVETSEMAKILRLRFVSAGITSLPQLDSFARYIRKGLDENEGLRQWVEAYVDRG